MEKYHQKTKCQNCGKQFDVYVYNLRNGYGKHCSKACSNQANSLGFKKGHRHFPWKGDPEEIGRKISRAKKGVKFTKEHIAKLVLARKAYYDRIGRKECRGKKRQKKCHKCVAWRKTVFERDDYTCQMCGARGVYIEADHLKSWSKHPKLRHVLSNGRTLCKPCHMKTPNYKSKAKTYG